MGRIIKNSSVEFRERSCRCDCVNRMVNRYLSHNMSTNEALVFLVVNFLRGISTEKGMRLIDDFLEKQNGKK